MWPCNTFWHFVPQHMHKNMQVLLYKKINTFVPNILSSIGGAWEPKMYILQNCMWPMWYWHLIFDIHDNIKACSAYRTWRSFMSNNCGWIINLGYMTQNVSFTRGPSYVTLKEVNIEDFLLSISWLRQFMFYMKNYT